MLNVRPTLFLLPVMFCNYFVGFGFKITTNSSSVIQNSTSYIAPVCKISGQVHDEKMLTFADLSISRLCPDVSSKGEKSVMLRSMKLRHDKTLASRNS